MPKPNHKRIPRLADGHPSLTPDRFMLRTEYKIRSKKLVELRFKNYESYLKSDHWIARRGRFAIEHEQRCAFCDQSADELHHWTYRNLGDEQDHDLEWFCSDHHEELQKYGKIKQASDQQRRILRDHGYSDAYVITVSMGQAFKLIGQLGRGEIRSPREEEN